MWAVLSLIMHVFSAPAKLHFRDELTQGDARKLVPCFSLTAPPRFFCMRGKDFRTEFRAPVQARRTASSAC